MKRELLETMLTNDSKTVKESMKQMDKAGFKVLIVVDNTGVLKGVVSDGDIRRWILADKSLNEPIKYAMNQDPMVLTEGYVREQCKEIMLKHLIEGIPIVDKNRKLVDLVLWGDCFSDERPAIDLKLPVVIMAGGLGARLEPITKVLPKPLVPVGEKTIIEHIIDRFTSYGMNEFIVSVNYKADMIKAYFKGSENLYKVTFVEERDRLGTIGSLSLLKGKINTPFFITNCDILVDANYADIYNYHRTNECKLTIVSSMVHYAVPYGVLSIENGGVLKGINEKPELDFLVNTGLYLIEPDILDRIPDGQSMDANVFFAKLRSEGSKVGVYPISQKSWCDIGQWSEYQKTISMFEGKTP